MDYLEGLLLGRLWSDTDYENRKHFGLFVLYGLFVDAIVLYIYILGRGLLGFGNLGPIHIAVFVLLFLANPFICFRYYRMPWWGKIFILAVKIFKAYLVISYTVSLLLPRLNVKVDDLQDFLMSYLNQTLEKYTEKFVATAGSFSTVVGVLAGGVHVSRNSSAPHPGSSSYPEPYFPRCKICSARMGLGCKYAHHQEVFPSEKIRNFKEAIWQSLETE